MFGEVMKVTLYHNPRCSKSRKTLELLQAEKIELDVVEYLKDPLSADELRSVVSQLGDDASVADIVRTGESAFKDAGLSLDDGETLFDAIASTPILMQRPIAVVNGKAAIGRPPESVLALLD